MRLRTALVSIAALVTLNFAGCRPWTSNDDQTRREREQQTDKDARKVGKEAYQAGQAAQLAADQAAEAAKQVGKRIEKAGKEVKEGWSDAQREQKSKDTKQQ